MHPLLARQARRAGVDLQALDPAVAQLLEHVSRAYGDSDQGRYLMERSLAIASREIRESYEATHSADERRIAALLEAAANDVIFTMDFSGTLTSVNAAVERLTGWLPSELVGRNFARIVAPELVPELAATLRRRRLGAPQPTLFEADLLTKSGGRVAVEFHSRTLEAPGREPEVLGVGRDVSHRREHERLHHLAHHDSLTGLSNRYALERVIAGASAARRHGQGVLMFLDLDNFKAVNDTAGHIEGDQVLVTVAEVIRANLRSEDALLRVGGDEFVIVITDTSPAAASLAADKIRRTLAEAQISLAGRQFSLGVSIGLTVLRHGDTAATAISRADAAMYQAKSEGRDRVVWHEQRGGGGDQVAGAEVSPLGAG